MPGRFVPRPTRPLGVTQVRGWSLKRSEITLDGIPISAGVLAAADRTLHRELPEAPEELALGFTIIHRGMEAVWLLSGVWRGDILYQRLCSAPLERPTEFDRVPPDGPSGCVWELRVLAHERDAFVTHILDPAEGPQVNAYLSETLTI